MKVSKRGEYALRALLALGYNYEKGLLQLKQIASREAIPYKFLEQIMIPLKKAEIVKSRKGRHGGYQLSRPPEQIRLGEIIRLIEGPLAPFADESELKRLVAEKGRHAGLYSMLLDVRNVVSNIIATQSLADLCQKNLELQEGTEESYMYFI